VNTTDDQSADPQPAGASIATNVTSAPPPFVAFADVLRFLRGLPGPCAPPIGAGAFDVLYASAREVVVWYAPAREGQVAREVAIPCAPLDAAWGALRDGSAVAEATLCALAGGAAGGRWLLVILGQLPMARVQADGDGVYTLAWSPGDAPGDTPDANAAPAELALITKRAEADAG
jgi:hypothetical protein